MSGSPAEVIAACLRTFAGPVFDDAVARIVFGQNATHLLAALEDAGWRLFRPGDCPNVKVFTSGLEGEEVDFDGQYLQVWGEEPPLGVMPPLGTYWLVPKGDDA